MPYSMVDKYQCSGSNFFQTNGTYLYTIISYNTHFNYLKPVIYSIYHTTVTFQGSILQMANYAIKHLKHRTVPKWKCKIQIQISLTEADISDGLSPLKQILVPALKYTTLDYSLKLSLTVILFLFLTFATTLAMYCAHSISFLYIKLTFQNSVLQIHSILRHHHP